MRYFSPHPHFLLALAFCLAVTAPAAHGQESQVARARSAASLTIAGEVFQPSGQPVSGAHVTVRSASGSLLQTTTNAHGEFNISELAATGYTVIAETQTLQSVPAAIAPGRTGKLSLRIVLTLPVAPKALASSQGLTFSDEPNFVVSGVTDWTAVGGHGSDATLRTSEDLARATSALKADNILNGSAAGVEEKELRAAVTAKPQAFEPNLRLGEFYLRTNDFSRAIIPLQTASAVDGQRPEAEYDLALACRGLNDLPQAKLHIQRALALKEAADYHRLAGDLAEQQGDPFAAVKHLERATRLDASEENYFAWGSELLLHRAVLQASEIFQTGANTYPSSARMQTGLGSALFAEAHYDEASKRLCAASDLQPNDSAAYLLLASIDNASPAPLPCVQERLARFLELAPENPEANYLYGMSLLRRSNNSNQERAEALLKETITLHPEHAGALLQLGILEAARQHYREAIDLYRRAISADPAQAEPHFRLAVAYDRTGKSEQAASERTLHNAIKLRTAEAVEQQRRRVKQFLIVLQQPPAQTSR